ncbi:MAG TPA: AMIN domain-containing protein, partial [candidate division Zixibacteria bacterium]|nr:AMIN domain-containing protein [candidate division Zixibacteria bacterium]
MKKILTILLAVLLVTTGSVLASRVNGINVSHDEEFTITKIDVEGGVRFTHQTEIAKDGKPFRIIVDVLAATHEMGAKRFINLPDCKVTGIRTSQYAVDPENIVRVVFDMRGETAYRIDSDEHTINIYFYDPDAGQFPIWSSYDFVNSEDTSAATAAIVETAVAESTATKTEVPAPLANDPASIIAAINQALDNDRMSSLEPGTTVPEEKPESSKVVEKQDTTSKPVMTETTVAKPTFGQEELGPVIVAEST